MRPLGAVRNLPRRLRAAALSGPDGVPVTVQRTNRRKTTGIIIEDGAIHVRAPRRLANWRIQALINDRADWIRKKLREQAERGPPPTNRYADGETLVFLGKSYLLAIIDDDGATIRLEGDRLIASRAHDQRAVVIDWYRMQAQTVLSETTRRFAVEMGLTPQSISVRSIRANGVAAACVATFATTRD